MHIQIRVGFAQVSTLDEEAFQGAFVRLPMRNNVGVPLLHQVRYFSQAVPEEEDTYGVSIFIINLFHFMEKKKVFPFTAGLPYPRIVSGDLF